MHVRFSACLGSPVYEHGGDELLGTFSGLLIHPDTGKIEGIYIEVRHFLHTTEFFCLGADIVHWGLSIQVRSAEALTHPEDLVRLRALFEDNRTILGQRMRTEGGQTIGMCRDIQFDTERLRIEWLFPRRFLRWGIALPVSEIIEVRPDAIVMRDAATPAPDDPVPEAAPPLPGLTETGVAGPTTTRKANH